MQANLVIIFSLGHLHKQALDTKEISGNDMSVSKIGHHIANLMMVGHFFVGVKSVFKLVDFEPNTTQVNVICQMICIAAPPPPSFVKGGGGGLDF